jgi:hypothetical protein
MNTITAARINSTLTPFWRYFPVLALLNPGRLTLAVIVSFMVGVAAGWAAYQFLGFPLWLITLIVMLALLPVGVVKWREDRRRYGNTVMLLSIVLVTQGLHTIEHLTQFVQYYILFLPARQSNGLLSPANSEVVHFVWNWAVVLVIYFLIRGGMQNFWTYLLMAVAVAHTLEHTYMFTHYLMVLTDLHGIGVENVTAQGLPGILGRDGWLARSPLTRGTFLSVLPGLTTAMRLDVHFWWNALEMSLLLISAHVFLPRWLTTVKKG